MNEQEKLLLTCESCGGVFENDLPECPYCGNINVAGAIDEYEEKLDDIQDDLEDLPEDVSQIYKKEISNHGKQVAKNIFIAIAVIGVIIATLFFLFHLLASRSSYTTEEIEAQIIWENQTFPMLDELFENRDYDALIEFIEEFYISTDYEQYNLVNWQHSDFMAEYRKVIQFEKVKKRFTAPKDLSAYDLSCIITLAFLELKNNEYTALDEEEMQILSPYQQDANIFLRDILKIDDETLNQLKIEVSADGLFAHKPIDDFSNKYIKSLK